jgi:DNA gyrase subunit A
LAKATDALLSDIDKDTVDFRSNYDDSDSEPTVLPAQYPNLLVNGAGGIAVGMATNIPPHNLGEIIDACIALVDEPAMEVAELAEIVKGPDFPTGGIILGRNGILEAYATGRGSVIVRGRSHFEDIRKDRQAIVVDEVPYLVNKGKMVERISEVVREKKVEGISEVRDESDRQGIRVVIELKREADADVVLNQLHKFTTLQTSFGINMVALNGGRPEVMTLKAMLVAFLEFREEVITRRSAFELAKARDRAHILVGLAVAVANIDEIIALIRRAPDPATAKAELVARDWPGEVVGPLLALVEPAGEDEGAPRAATYRLSDEQAKAILELRLQRLTALERDKIRAELEEIAGRIQALLLILRSRERLLEVVKEEMLAVRSQFADARRTEIDVDADADVNILALIQREDMVVTVTHKGYIKRVPLSTYRAQRRGGRGRAGMKTHDDDFVTRVLVSDTHTPMLFFSTRGRVYRLDVWRLPLGTPQARGKAMINLFPHLAEGETITAVLPLPEDETAWDRLSIFFATARGRVRRNDLAEFKRVPTQGKIGMGLDDGDQLVGVDVCDERHDILLAADGGKAVRFPVESVRVFQSRSSEGVRGMDLAEGDAVISMSVLDHVELSIEERDEYARWANARRRAAGETAAGETAALEDGEGEAAGEAADAVSEESFELHHLTPERLAELQAREQLILTITVKGYGKRTSAFEYRVTNRGTQGIINIDTSERNGRVAATFPVAEDDQLMLVTDRGQTIRIPVHDIRITSRGSQGVRLFHTDGEERVVSAARLSDSGEDDDAEEIAEDGEA